MIEQDELERPYANTLQFRTYDSAKESIAQRAVRHYDLEEQGKLLAADLSAAELEQLQNKATERAKHEAKLRQLTNNARSVMEECSMWETVTTCQGTSDNIDSKVANNNTSQNDNATHKTQIMCKDIFHAACDGDVDTLYEYYKRGVNLNLLGQPNPEEYHGVQFTQRWTFRATPLIFAVAFNRERAVEALLSWNANPMVKSSTGLTPLDYAHARKYNAIINILEVAMRNKQEICQSN